MTRSLEILEREGTLDLLLDHFKIRKSEELGKLHPFLHYVVIFLLYYMEAAQAAGVSQLAMLRNLQPGARGARRFQHIGVGG
jgi:hypothetical protein